MSQIDSDTVELYNYNIYTKSAIKCTFWMLFLLLVVFLTYLKSSLWILCLIMLLFINFNEKYKV